MSPISSQSVLMLDYLTLLISGESLEHPLVTYSRINLATWGFIPKIYSIYLNWKISKLCQMFASNPLIALGPGGLPVAPVPSASLWVKVLNSA